MTSEKVMDLFSEYYENTLDPSLRKIVAARIKSEPNLELEYQKFQATMNSLGILPSIDILVPTNLNDSIGQHLDKHILETRTQKSAPWLILVRNVSFAVAASVAIAGTYLSLSHRSSTESDSSVFSGASDHLHFSNVNSNVVVKYAPESSTLITLYSDPSGTLIKSIHLNGKQVLSAPLENSNPESTLMRVNVSGQASYAVVALPGTKMSMHLKGSGNLEDLAQAVANMDRIPVVLENPDLQKTVEWNFKGNDVLTNVQSTLSPIGFSADKRNGGILYITKSS